MTDGDMSQANSWSSPFESQNLEQQFPTLAGGLQTGSLVDAIRNSTDGSLDGATNKLRATVKAGGLSAVPAAIALAAVEGAKASGISLLKDLDSLKGKSPFTKINSTMVYLGSAPVKISATLFFRAWTSAGFCWRLMTAQYRWATWSRTGI